MTQQVNDQTQSRSHTSVVRKTQGKGRIWESRGAGGRGVHPDAHSDSMKRGFISFIELPCIFYNNNKHVLILY